MMKRPSVSNLAFYQPACLVASLDAEALADLEATSHDIAYMISEGRQVPDGWGVIHLVRRMDLFAGCPCAIKALSEELDCEKARWQGGNATFRIRHFRHHSCNQYADGFGQILNELQDKPGYSASWLLSQLTVQVATPSLPHRHGGEFRRINGPLARYHRGSNAITKFGPSFNASSVLSLPPTSNHRGEYQRVDGTLVRY
jgi:hypothetical protein